MSKKRLFADYLKNLAKTCLRGNNDENAFDIRERIAISFMLTLPE